jgi:hypothetical protein
LNGLFAAGVGQAQNQQNSQGLLPGNAYPIGQQQYQQFVQQHPQGQFQNLNQSQNRDLTQPQASQNYTYPTTQSLQFPLQPPSLAQPPLQVQKPPQSTVRLQMQNQNPYPGVPFPGTIHGQLLLDFQASVKRYNIRLPEGFDPNSVTHEMLAQIYGVWRMAETKAKEREKAELALSMPGQAGGGGQGLIPDPLQGVQTMTGLSALQLQQLQFQQGMIGQGQGKEPGGLQGMILQGQGNVGWQNGVGFVNQ